MTSIACNMMDIELQSVFHIHRPPVSTAVTITPGQYGTFLLAMESVGWWHKTSGKKQKRDGGEDNWRQTSLLGMPNRVSK
jgi:hypothetical protein